MGMRFFLPTNKMSYCILSFALKIMLNMHTRSHLTFLCQIYLFLKQSSKHGYSLRCWKLFKKVFVNFLPFFPFSILDQNDICRPGWTNHFTYSKISIYCANAPAILVVFVLDENRRIADLKTMLISAAWL